VDVTRIDGALVGRTSATVHRSWTADDAMLYALGVGAGQMNPLSELEFTTENTAGHDQLALPTFANVAFGVGPPLPEDLDYAAMLHAEQAFELHEVMPTEGEAHASCEVVGVYDKGSGALIETRTSARDSGGSLLATLRTSVFFRGHGGFGGDRGESARWRLPDRAPDHVVIYPTRTDQALLYRLTGDHNPLHTDPSYSSRGGFERPILHGMCTYGYTGRALLHAVAESDPKRFKAMTGRFTKPILPGETITVSIWVDGETVRFRTTDSGGTAVIDHGRAVIV
jgi:acyl dehydratase